MQVKDFKFSNEIKRISEVFPLLEFETSQWLVNSFGDSLQIATNDNDAFDIEQ